MITLNWIDIANMVIITLNFSLAVNNKNFHSMGGWFVAFLMLLTKLTSIQ